MLKTSFIIVKNECLLCYREKHEWLTPLLFFMLILFLFSMILPENILKNNLPGFYWISVLFCNMLALQNIFKSDLEDEHLTQCILSPTSLSITLLAKLAAIWLFTQLPLLCMISLTGLFFHLNTSLILGLLTTFLLSTPVIVLLSSLSLALSIGLKQQGLFLGLILLSLLMPLLILSLNILELIKQEQAISHAIAALASISLISITCLPFCIASVLRLRLDIA